MNKKKFNPILHLPSYSKHILDILQTPLLVYFALVGNLIMFGGMGAFYYFEKPVNDKINTFFDTLWWGITTVTTVGYGDVTPVTYEGKLVAIVLMVTGVIFFVSFVSVLSSFLMIKIEEHESNKSKESIDQLRKEIHLLNNKLDQLLANDCQIDKNVSKMK